MNKQAHDPTNLTYGIIVGASMAIITMTVLIVWADLAPEMKNWLKVVFSHHWVGKGIIGTISFLIFGLMASAGQLKTEAQVERSVTRLFITSLVGISTLTLFFLYEAFYKG